MKFNITFALAFGSCLLPINQAYPASPETETQNAAPEPDLLLRQPPSPLRDLIERYSTDRGALDRFYSVSTSPERHKRMKRFYEDWRDRIDKIDFDSLNQDGRVDYLLFKNKLAYELRQVELKKAREAEMDALIPFESVILDLHESRRRLETIDAAKTAQWLNQLNKEIEETRKTLEAGLKTDAETEADPIKKSVANRAARTVRQLRRTLKDWFDYYHGYDPIFTWWVSEPHAKVDAALEDYAAFLREKLVGVKKGDDDAIVGDPIGREALLTELASEMIPYSPEELIAIANRQFAWCDAEMLKASRDLGYGDDWKAALEHVKTLHVPPGKQPDLIRDLAREVVDFIEQRDLVTIPQLCKDTWRMEMMTPERQKVTPFFTGGEVISVSYPTEEMTHEQKMMSMRGNNIHFSRATVHHELIPGHHLQGFMAARHRTYRKAFRTPFYVEGWALYWEMYLWDLDFPRSPENRIGMLFWRMHRCARIVFSLSFHLEEMTAQEAIDYLVDRVGHERDNATAEVRRSVNGSYGPLYQCAYMLGGLQIRALHEELVDSGKMTNREFHDAVLKENAIPIEMVRASLTNRPLTRDFESSWKFAGENPAEGEN